VSFVEIPDDSLVDLPDDNAAGLGDGELGYSFEVEDMRGGVCGCL
jgi:hypothetical protein